MNRRLMLVLTAGGALATVALATGALTTAALAQQGRSTASGVYTAEQAQQGEALYQANCAICHGERLGGTYEIPALTGRFLRNWSNGSVFTLFDYVRHAMPLMAPGSLSDDDNAKIVAYLLQQNGMPAGAQPLPSEEKALAAIPFRPVPAAPVKANR